MRHGVERENRGWKIKGNGKGGEAKILKGEARCNVGHGAQKEEEERKKKYEKQGTRRRL